MSFLPLLMLHLPAWGTFDALTWQFMCALDALYVDSQKISGTWPVLEPAN